MLSQSVTNTEYKNTKWLENDHTVWLNNQGPVVQNLTLLVSISLKFQTLISQICQYFLLKKCEELLQCKAPLIFLNKNISVFGY